MDDEIEWIKFDVKNPAHDVFRETDIRARQHMSADRTMTYKEAVHAVFTADPDLHRAYLEETPPIHMNRSYQNVAIVRSGKGLSA